MYKNIERKQRFIDERQYAYDKFKKREAEDSVSRTRLFNSVYYKEASVFKQEFSPRNRGEEPDPEMVDKEFEALMNEVMSFPV